MDEIRDKLNQLQDRFNKIATQFNQDKLRAEIANFESKIQQPGFWSDQQKAKAISRQLSDKQKLVQNLEDLKTAITDTLELINDETMHSECEAEASQIDKILSDLEVKLFLSNPHDDSEAILSVHAGTGGVEAMDWTGMLARMYQRYFDKQGWEYEISDESIGLEAGYKSITMIIHQSYSYGLLKGEAGTHRLVRQSPFNADNLRQTSFALVEVLPVIESDTEVEMNPKDVEFEAFRSGGAGGQNVNKVNTAVRIRHIPTNIVVTTQTERSQLQNRENAMKLLKAKLWQMKKNAQKQSVDELKGTFRQATWGTQIRSYVLHPYHLVKDLRTNVAISDTDSVLGGNLDQFIEAEVKLDK